MWLSMQYANWRMQGEAELAVSYLYSFVASLDESGRLVVLAPAAQAVGAALGPAVAVSLLGGAAYAPVSAVAAVALVGSMVCVIRVRH